MTWDFTQSPELREALIDLLADALCAYVERAEAPTGVTPTGNARTAEKVRPPEELRDALAPVGAPAATPAPPVCTPPADAGIAAPRGVSASWRAVSGRGAEAVQGSGLKHA